MFDFIRTYIIDRNNAELLFFLAQSLIILVAISALLYARAQVAEARSNSRIIARQAQANSLLSLEERWNSEPMRQARLRLIEVSSRLRDEAFKENMHLKDDAALGKVQEKFTVELKKLRKEDDTKYIELMRSLGFYETVGILVRRNYVAIEDVDLLLRGPIVDFGLYFTPHIEERQREKGVPPGLGENALLLVERIKSRARL